MTTTRFPLRPVAALAVTALALGAAACGTATGTAAPTTAATTTGTARAAPDPASCDPQDPGLGVLQSWVPRSDVDGDGLVSRAEFVADGETSRRTWDTDRDGDLAGDEATRAAEETVVLLETESARPDYLCLESDPPDAAAAPPAGAPPADGAGLPDLVATVDTDRDGTMSNAEWTGGTAQRFDAIDCDDDGALTTAEAFRFGRQEPCPAG